MVREVANVEQAAAWDGPEGDHWATHADWYDRAVRRHHRRLLDAAAFTPTDRVLDVGCGNGQSTRDAARAAASGSALGIDLSAHMLERARERSRAEGLDNVTFTQADAQVHPFGEDAFDVVISRFGAMFFADPVAAFANVRRAVSPGGRLTLLAWRTLAENEWLRAIREALAAGRTLPEPPPGAPSPFGLADPDRVRHVLTEAGFAGVECTPVDEPIELGSDAEAAFEFVQTGGVGQGLLRDLDDTSRACALDALRSTMAAHDTGEGVLFGSAAWLITAQRA